MKLAELKDRIKDYGKTPEQLIASDPQYQDAIDRLRNLSRQRDLLQNQLNRIEIDIDMILAMIGANEEKKALEKEGRK